MNPSRQGIKHIGGYFSPEVSRQLRMIAAAEDTSNQKLLAEALDMLFHGRDLQPVFAVLVAANGRYRLLGEGVKGMLHLLRDVLQDGVSDVADEQVRLRMSDR